MVMPGKIAGQFIFRTRIWKKPGETISMIPGRNLFLWLIIVAIIMLVTILLGQIFA